MKQQTQKKVMSLLKKGQKGIPAILFSRLFLILLLLVLQVALILGTIYWFEGLLPHVYGSSFLISVVMVLFLINSRLDPTAKITWLVVILVLPVFGSIMYLFTEREIGQRAMKARLIARNQKSQNLIPQNAETFAALQQSSPGAAALARYIHRSGCYPVFENTKVTYFPQGEEAFLEMLVQLDKAEKFIFLEYFVVEEGLMWGSILDILARKAAQGVDVRLLYDGTCEFFKLSHNYPQRLKQLGIQCKMFAPVSPFISTHYNYRDHRKILVIDGHTAFNGGVNLADEYINHIQPYGYWKDTAVMLQGDAVRSFTQMFLQMWYFDEKKPEFSPFLSAPTNPPAHSTGFILPFGDCPLDNDKVGKQVYMDILNRAERYVHILSPYLILDGDLENAMVFAAERGVDVSIVIPGISDQMVPHALACTHYKPLLEAGVKIYEYTPGYVHAKVFVSDDREAVVGTINLDYRSLYHHFECATYLNGVACIGDIEADFLQTMEKSKEITLENRKEIKFSRRLLGFLAKAVAPLL